MRIDRFGIAGAFVGLVALVAACTGEEGVEGEGKTPGPEAPAPSFEASVSPTGNMLVELDEGESPSSDPEKTYELTNEEDAALAWQASVSAPWCYLKGPAAGVLQPGETVAVAVCVDAYVAGSMDAGEYDADLRFDEPESESAIAQRGVRLTVRPIEDGWTPFEPAADTRILYVSSSSGVDTSDYNYHVASDPEVGGDPFDPTGPVYAYQTLGAAVKHLRDGSPDWLLLARGDTWAEGIKKWELSGASEADRMLVGAYGTGARPKLETFSTKYGPNDPDATFDHTALLSLEFTAAGISRLVGGHDFLVEDCLMAEGVGTAIVIQGDGPTPLTQVAIRRSLVFDRYTDVPGNHCQGLFISKVDGVRIEECFFDHNGWSETVPDAEATIFNHNVYIQKTCSDVVFAGNVTANASSHGCQQRADGLVEDNLFLRNPIGLLVGSNQINESDWPHTYAGSGQVRNNVILDGRDIDPTNRRGVAIWGEMTDALEIYGNIAAHQQTGTDNCDALRFGLNNQDVHIHDNVVYDWRNPTEFGKGRTLLMGGSLFGSSVVEDNALQQPNWGALSVHLLDFTAITYQGNQYFSAEPESGWFTPGDSIAEWEAASGEVVTSPVPVAYPDPSRSIESYAGDVLGIAPTLDAFLAECRLQAKGNWRPELTAEAVNGYIREGFGVTPLY